MPTLRLTIWLLTLLLAACTSTGPQAARPCSDSAETSVHCGSYPSAIFDSSGRLWTVFVQGRFLFLSYSNDLGGSFSTPVAINQQPESIDANGENRPKIALGTRDEIYVSWTQKGEQRFSGNIRFSRSLDGGEHFSDPMTINDDGLVTGHRFDSLIVNQAGDILLSWIDKRDLFHAGESFIGASVYLAHSNNRGASFHANRPVAQHSCECCRLAATLSPDDHLVLFWRQIYGTNTRDHHLAELDQQGKLIWQKRATQDDWQIDACPHHGPAIAAAMQGEYHLAWFSNGRRQSGLFYARSSSTETSSPTPMSSLASDSHPQVLALDKQVYYVWKHFSGQTEILLKKSADNGNSWSEVKMLASTTAGSDHPSLLSFHDQAFLGWHTEAEGYRLIPLP